MKPIVTPPIDWLAVAPVIALVGAAAVVILVRSIFRHAARVYEASLVVGFVGIVVAALFLARQWSSVQDHGAYTALADMMAIDGFSVFLGFVVLISTALALLLSSEYLGRRGIESRPEYVALLLCSAAGMLVMTTANDLIVVFVALEGLSIPLYVLAAYDRRRERSLEAGIKYFVLGAFSSAVLLYGTALVYGGAGTTSLTSSAGTGIAQFLAHTTLLENGTLLAGLVLVLVGIGFKVSAVPFHMWTPDVYDGAPTPITAFMASATKAAGFAALLRILMTGFRLWGDDWRPIIWALAILTLVVGSIAALLQPDIKRMLAYSSISHAGYVLMGVQAGTARGVRAALFYLLVYAFMTIGAFAVVGVLGRRDDRHLIRDYRGLAGRRPVLAGFLIFFLLAQAGVPPTGGFIAKLGVFAASAAAHSYALLIVGVVTSVISAYFYLRVIIVMYTGAGSDAGAAAEGSDGGSDGVEPVSARRRVDTPTAVVLVVCAAVVLWVGILPTVVLDLAHDATLIL
jgi:NADH-quinone oxidoreductase subunit N